MRRSAVATVSLVGLAVVGLLVGGWTSPAPMRDLPATISAPAGVLPQAVYRAGPDTVAAYMAAITDPDVLAAVPCLCGCQQSLGHRNNLDCYVAGTEAHGIVDYSTHGIDCSVCQTITQIAVNGDRNGLSAPELRERVLNHYGIHS